MKTRIWGLLLLSTLSLQSLYATRYFVTPEGNDDNDGLSWETPVTLNGILTDTKLVEGDEILVKKGTYMAPEGASFTCNRAAVKVYGNCEGTEVDPPTSYQLDKIETYLVGSGRRVLYFKTASYLVGFDISGGDAYNSTAGGSGRGGGVYIDDPDGVIEYCIIHDNYGSKLAEIKGVGGGIYARGTVKNCIVEDNIATAAEGKKPGVGGGVCLEGGYLINTIVRNNSCVDENVNNTSAGGNVGGGVSIKTGYVVNCLIEGNVIGGTPNNSNYGGGIDCSLVSEPAEPGIVAHIINCTIVGNDATSGRGGGIGFGNKGSSEVVNCIVVDNVARPEATPDGSNIFMGAESTTEVSYTLWPEAESGTGNISEAPLFVEGTYTLQSSSPAVNAGNNEAIAGYDTDLAGKARVFDEVVDLGAYEFDGIASAVDDVVVDADDPIVEVQYFTLSGARVEEPQVTGIYLVKKIHASQKYSVEKMIFVYK